MICLKKSILLCVFFVSIFLTQNIFTQTNPFLPHYEASIKKDSITSGTTRQSLPIKKITRKSPFLRKLIQYQKVLNEKLTFLLHSIKEDFTVKHSFILFIVAFLYGIIHSLGPGHGKVIIGSYMASNKHKVRDSFFAGSLFAMTHTGVAAILFLIIHIVFKLNQLTTASSSFWLLKISGIMISVIGIFLFVHSFYDSHHAEDENKLEIKKMSLPLLSIVTGLAPCPGALLLLIFSQIIGVPFWGFAAVIFLSIGMALTVSMFGIIGTLAQRTMESKIESEKFKTIGLLIRRSGAVFIFIVGLSIFIGFM